MAAFDYSNRDYDTIKQDLLARADRVFPEWTDRDPSDFGMLLLDLWAYNADVLHYYIDRAAGEAFLPTAQQRESVLALANLLDYTPRGRTNAIASMTLVNTGAEDYEIPPLTEFIARYDDKTYQVYTQSGGLVPATSSGVITVLEGALTIEETLTSSSNGQGGQRYALSSDNVVERSLQVFVYENGVDQVPYQRVSRISASSTGERVFATTVNAENDVEVVFGTSVNGFVPPTGAKITATYSASSGAAGNLPANAVTAFMTFTPENISIIGTTAFSGGVDEESISSLKRSIPSVISAQNRAVTRGDFISLALQVDGVAKASLSFVPSAGGASAGNASVTIFPQPQRSDFLTTSDTFQSVSAEMQNNIVSSIQQRALLGVEVLCASQVDWQPIDVHVTVHVNERFVSNWVRRDVNAAIDSLFKFDNVHFGQRVTLGQVYRLVLNVPGVDYCVITLFDEQGGGTLQDNIVVDELELPKKGDVLLTMVGGITTT